MCGCKNTPHKYSQLNLRYEREFICNNYVILKFHFKYNKRKLSKLFLYFRISQSSLEHSSTSCRNENFIICEQIIIKEHM